MSDTASWSNSQREQAGSKAANRLNFHAAQACFPGDVHVRGDQVLASTSDDDSGSAPITALVAAISPSKLFLMSVGCVHTKTRTPCGSIRSATRQFEHHARAQVDAHPQARLQRASRSKLDERGRRRANDTRRRRGLRRNPRAAACASLPATRCLPLRVRRTRPGSIHCAPTPRPSPAPLHRSVLASYQDARRARRRLRCRHLSASFASQEPDVIARSRYREGRRGLDAYFAQHEGARLACHTGLHAARCGPAGDGLPGAANLKRQLPRRAAGRRQLHHMFLCHSTRQLTSH